MLAPIETSQYLRYLAQYKSGVRFQPNTPDYNVITLLESKDPRFTQSAREQNGVNVPSLTYIEPLPTGTPKPEGETTPRGENIFSLSTSTQPKPLNIGLPPGTTPDITKETTTTETTTTESFISKYKMPLIIGAIAIGYFFLRKKK